jgi:hypothetical protein
MPSWNDVHGYITSNYEKTQATEDMLTLNFRTKNLRSQVVFVGGGDTFVFFSSPFAEVGQVQPGKVLELATIFGVKQVGDLYCVTHVALTDTIDTSEIDIPLALMAENADEIEKSLGLSNTF